MSVVTSDYLAGVLTNFRLLFERNFDAAIHAQPWTGISMMLPSNVQTETYSWFGTVPKMEDVTHQDLKVEGLEPFDFSITNLLWKAGIEVERTAMEDDRLGQFTPRVQQLGVEAARHPGELIFNLFESNGNAYDSVAFFSNTRTIGASANIDNILSGTGATTVALIQADLASARAQMRKFQDDRGRPMNLTGNVIVVPPELEQIFYQALNANQGNIANPVVPGSAFGGSFNQASYSVVVNPFLTDANDWYLLHVDGATRPFIYQERLSPSLEGITSPNSESGVIHDKFVYSVRYRGQVGYGEPRHAVKTTNT